MKIMKTILLTLTVAFGLSIVAPTQQIHAETIFKPIGMGFLGLTGCFYLIATTGALTTSSNNLDNALIADLIRVGASLLVMGVGCLVVDEALSEPASKKVTA